MSAQQVIPTERLLPRGKHAQDVVRDQVSPEIIFGVVGHIGSGVSTIADALETALVGYKVQRIKAREVITEWAATAGTPLPEGSSKSARMTEQLQDRGDELRKSTGDHAAVAVAMVRKLRLARATMDGVTPQPGDPIEPSQEKRAFILDSIRHPAEAELLRAVYRSAFVLIGIVCEEDLRRERLVSKYEDAGISKATDLMARDAKAREKWGQRVSDAFHLSDYFIDNSEPRFREGEANAEWDVPDQLRRLIKLVTRDGVIAPTVAEQAMHAAFGAAMRSACLSRQVGAAIVNRSGAIIATGTNEVPRAGGGVYTSPAPDEDTADHRCAYTSLQDKKFCSNTREQVEIAKELRDELKKTLSEQAQLLEKENGKKAGDNANDIAKAVRALLDNEATGAAITTALRESRIGGLLEFSRAVHAEMDAIIAATRTGAQSTCGASMFVTTFPCHYCARHIVAAGIDEVQYIEPYPKSKALLLHRDAITTRGSNWLRPSEPRKGDEKRTPKVLVRPFVGVAPRLYAAVFLKMRELKDSNGYMSIQELPWGDPLRNHRVSYAQVEAAFSLEK